MQKEGLEVLAVTSARRKTQQTKEGLLGDALRYSNKHCPAAPLYWQQLHLQPL